MKPRCSLPPPPATANRAMRARRGTPGRCRVLRAGGSIHSDALLRKEVGGDHPGATGRGKVTGEGVPRHTARRGSSRSSPGSGRRWRRPPRRCAGRRRRLKPAAQRDVDGVLDDRAVHQRVAVGQADLDHVDACVDHCDDGLDPAGDAGVAGRQVADEQGTAGGRRRRRRASSRDGALDLGLQTARAPRRARPSTPNQRAAVSLSLSPRPDRLIKDGEVGLGSRPSATCSRPQSQAPANACALSIAGRMPSVSASMRKHCIAHASVTGR